MTAPTLLISATVTKAPTTKLSIVREIEVTPILQLTIIILRHNFKIGQDPVDTWNRIMSFKNADKEASRP